MADPVAFELWPNSQPLCEKFVLVPTQVEGCFAGFFCSCSCLAAMQSAARFPTMRRREKRLVHVVCSPIVVPQPSVRARSGFVQVLECMLYTRLRDGFRILFLCFLLFVGAEGFFHLDKKIVGVHWNDQLGAVPAHEGCVETWRWHACDSCVLAVTSP